MNAKEFISNNENEFNCQECPYNIGATWPEFILPCSQQHCWVALNASDEEDHD